MELAASPIVLTSPNLELAERRLCVEALTSAGNIVGAAKLLGITRHSLKRRIIKLGIPWTRQGGRLLDAPASASATSGRLLDAPASATAPSAAHAA